jgi:hypothetical protein
MAYDKFGVKEVMNVTFYDLENHKPVLYVDTLKMSSLENTAEESNARGGWGNPKLLTWDYNREANFTIQDALIGFDGLALMTGNEVTGTGADDYSVLYKREILDLSGSEGARTATLSEVPVDPDDPVDSGTKDPKGDVSRVFLYSFTEGIMGDTLSATINANKSISDIVTTETKAVAYYPYVYANTEKLRQVTITSDNFPSTFRIVGDTFIRSANTGRDEYFQLIVERAKVQPGFSLTMEAEGDPSVFDMNITVLRPLEGTEMIKLIKYGEMGS